MMADEQTENRIRRRRHSVLVLSVHLCVHPLFILQWTRYVTNHSWEFHQIFNVCCTFTSWQSSRAASITRRVETKNYFYLAITMLLSPMNLVIFACNNILQCMLHEVCKITSLNWSVSHVVCILYRWKFCWREDWSW